jgi:hypothetical protein
MTKVYSFVFKFYHPSYDECRPISFLKLYPLSTTNSPCILGQTFAHKTFKTFYRHLLCNRYLLK